MKTLEELTNLYENELMPSLLGIESQRKALRRNSIVGYFLLGLFIFIFIYSFQLYNTGQISTLAVRVIVAGSLLVIGLLVFFVFNSYLKRLRKYKKEYKKEVVSKIIHLLNPKWKYKYKKKISRTEYHKSHLYWKKEDSYRGDDLVTGVIDKTDFELCELHTRYKTKDSKGKDQWHTIFRGLFLHADFNKNIQGQTFVLPDRAEKLLGKFGRAFQKGQAVGNLVQLENLSFEKEYAVYSNDQVEARYILTPTIMEALVRIKDLHKRKVLFSFTGSRVYCAMPFRKPLFEPRIMRSGVRFDDVEKIFTLMQLIETVITELNLNTRIWTKE